MTMTIILSIKLLLLRCWMSLSADVIFTVCGRLPWHFCNSGLIYQVTLHWAGLVLGWVTLNGMRKEYWWQCSDAVLLSSNGMYSTCGYTCVRHVKLCVWSLVSTCLTWAPEILPPHSTCVWQVKLCVVPRQHVPYLRTWDITITLSIKRCTNAHTPV